jgi:O-methyltransferase
MDLMRERYLDLVAACATGSIHAQPFSPVQFQRGSWRAMLLSPIAAALRTKKFYVCRKQETIAEGSGDRPESALTMIGKGGIANIRRCLETVLRENVPGDFIEAGVWRGGACIFAKALLDAAGSEKSVWVADSFQGVPPPNAAKYPADAGDQLYKSPEIAVSLEDVIANFKRFGLLDDRVKFLPGWFQDTLPSAPIEQLSVLRLDGDLYESTWDSLTSLYSKLSVGGYCIVDDYHDLPACTQAVEDFRAKHGIAEEIHPIDDSSDGCYWRKS